MSEIKDMHDTTRQMITNILRKEIDSSNTRGIYYVMYRLDNWNLNVKDWPEVEGWINDEKTRIIRELLVNLRQGGSGIGSTNFTIDRLHKIGIHWPELDTIKKSIDADISISEGGDLSQARQNAMQNARRLSSKLERLRKAFDSPHSLDDTEAAMSTMIDALYIMEGMRIGYRDLVMPILDHHKGTLIKILLIMIRERGIGYWGVNEIINELHRLSVSWPELRVIDKSIASHIDGIAHPTHPPDEVDEAIFKTEDGMTVKQGKGNQLTENETDHFLTRSIMQIQMLLQHVKRDPKSRLYPFALLVKFERMVEEGSLTKEKAAAALGKIKDDIIAYFLSMIKKGNNWEWRDAAKSIDELKRVGVDWPELDMIKRGIKSSIPSVNENTNDDSNDDHFAEDRQNIVDEVIDAMTNGGSIRTFREAKNAMQALDREGEDMLADTMRRQKNSIIANLVDMFFTSERRNVEALMQLIDYSPHNIPELSRLPDSILPTVEKEFDDRSHHQGLAKTLEDVDALVENGFNRDYLMTDIGEYKLSGFIRNYAVGTLSSTKDLSRDLSAMLEIGVDRDELLPIVEKRKVTIIKSLLTGMKNRNYHDVNVFMEALDDLGVQWTELAAVRKSLGSLNTLGESNGENRIHPIVNMVADKIKAAIDRGDDHGVGYAIQVLSRVDPQQVYDGLKRIAPDLARWFDKMVKSSPSFALDELLRISYYMSDLHPQVLKALDDHRDDVLKVLLSRLRHEGNERQVLQTVKYLADQGLRWKELGVINRSLIANERNQ